MRHPRLPVLALACAATLTQLAACSNAAERPPLPTLHPNAPTIVLQAGLGDSSDVWRQVRQQLPAGAVVVAPDRPGYGREPFAEGPRDPCTIARELHETLRRSGHPPPYLLVGHSLGGLYQYAYARLYPADVKGLLLLEATHPHHLERVTAESPSSATLIKVARMAMGRAPAAEFDAQTRCLEAWEAAPPLGVPTRVLMRADFSGLEAGSFEPVVRGLQQDWLRLTGARRVETVAGTGHYLQKDQPRVVAEAIVEMAR
ncbi:alpha/beta fold hydrolase [Roseateles cellulosilyticus]|uniref:Alpha/beta fold hydrolase n=1 Tax=Pelomonas cellulosilytica TaxID=2906762 RepID=A0ABS8XR91_9BURK|nr:alpha/beta hydrolase family protein [Pelomonas sp. P8]MCE4553422.1 alpha/beta fold hydrolase [Pelomonas sp. P8]